MPLTAKEILSDRSASEWIQYALMTALDRDPVDAANDAEVLAEVLGARCDQALGRDMVPEPQTHVWYECRICMLASFGICVVLGWTLAAVVRAYLPCGLGPCG